MYSSDHLKHEELYRGKGVLQKRHESRILLCGMGALGSFLADLLARQGYFSLTGIDMDKVEKSNFGTQNYGKQDVGRLKADQTRANIYRRLDVEMNAISKKITRNNVKKFISSFELVLDLFDNGESRELLRTACKVSSIPCLHAGLAAMGFFEIMWNETYKSPPSITDDNEIPCEYPMASNLVMMCVATTAEIVNRFVDFGEKWNAEFWLKSGSFSFVQT